MKISYICGTYYRTEWNAMTADEKSEWQSRVDYEEVLASSDDDPVDHHADYGHSHGNGHDHASATPTGHDVAPQPADGQETSQQQSIPATPEEPEDNEVHVVGVAVQNNGHGGLATFAGIQSGEEMAVVVDVDSDGTIDIIGTDENGNEHLEQNEWHDVHDEGFSTVDVVSAYVDEAHEHGEQPVVTDLDSGQQLEIVETEDGFNLAGTDALPMEPEPDYTDASDDMPDYVNDALIDV